ncbi:MAG: EAL domain-containing protein [bacterium]|nr:EAL domain-containing protein [bacterium]
MVNDTPPNIAEVQRLSMPSNLITNYVVKIAVCEQQIVVVENLFEEDEATLSFIEDDSKFFEQMHILCGGIQRGEKQFSFEYNSKNCKRWFMIKANYTDCLINMKYPIFNLLITDITYTRRMAREETTERQDLAGVVESIKSCVIRIENTKEYSITWANKHFYTTFGNQKSFLNCIDVEDRSKLRYIIENELSVNTFSKKMRFHTLEGKTLWYDVRIVKNGREHKGCNIYCILTDVTDSVNTLQELKSIQKRYEIVLSVTSELVYEYDLKRDTIFYFRTGAEDLRRPNKIENFTNVMRHGSINGSYLTEDSKKQFNELKRQFSLKRLSSKEEHFCFLRPNGTEQWINVIGKALHDQSGNLELIVGRISDATDYKKHEKTLLQEARMDALTKVSNRQHAKDEINKYLKEHKKKCLSSLLILDIDNFKAINDNYGHGTGDAVLIKISSLLRREFHKDDIVGRLGGDEFIVFLKEVKSKEMVMEKAKQICESVNHSFHNVSVSIGITVNTDDETDFDRLYHTADAALYQAKNKGKNTFVSYDELDENIQRNMLKKSETFIINTNNATSLTEREEEKDYTLQLAKQVIGHYKLIYHVNLTTDSVTCYHTGNQLQSEHNFRTYTELYEHVENEIISKNEKEQFQNYASIENIKEVLSNGKKRFETYIRLYSGKNAFCWYSVEVINHFKSEEEDLYCTFLVKDMDETGVERMGNWNMAKHLVYEKELAEYVNFDPLTGLYKPDKLFYKARNVLNHFTTKSFALMTFNINRFRIFNDMYGEEITDNILMKVADVLRSLEANDKLYSRYQSDQFIVFLSYSSSQELLNVIETIRSECDKIFASQVKLKLSFGIYQINDRTLPVRLMYDRAKLAEYSVKGLTMQHYAFYNEVYREQLIEQQIIENEMEQALREGQFEMYLQPSYDLRAGNVIGAEALSRWKHPTRGMINPDKFIPLFEKNGFIIQLDEYIWEEACKKLSKWYSKGYEIPISVNISRVHTYDIHFIEKMVKLVETYHIPRYLLQLEFTESMFTEDGELLCNLMQRLKEQGFTLLMDDFGSGYSSLNMLKNMPVDIVKLDRIFFDDIMENMRGKIIIQSSIRMIHELALDVTAEGIEKQEHVEFLNSCNCTKGQGYFYAKPMAVHEFETLYFENKKTDVSKETLSES